MLTDKTTRDHHKYYSELSKQVIDEEVHAFLTKNNLTKKEILEFYKQDSFLLNMGDNIFDSNIHPAAKIEPHLLKLVNSCLWKFILIYRVLGATPKFILNASEFFGPKKGDGTLGTYRWGRNLPTQI